MQLPSVLAAMTKGSGGKGKVATQATGGTAQPRKRKAAAGKAAAPAAVTKAKKKGAAQAAPAAAAPMADLSPLRGAGVH